MPVQIGEKRQAGFDDPLGMLSDCHRRIERFLAALLKIARERKGGALSEAEREALRSSLEYFQTSGPRHTADEEESLFPRMRSCEAGRAALDRVEALRADHIVASAAHAQVDELGARWLQEGHLREPDAACLTALLESLSELYARHIGIEDSELFPAAERALRRDDIASMGEEMAQRRGLR